MGRCLGKYVVVFNCSSQMDFRGLGRIFKGLAQSGVFNCFDEFNRLELPVLSVAAQQIAILLLAKKEEKTTFLFTDADEISLDPEFGIFITMNPGYAGRQQLPENLKTNFRMVAMMVPDRQIIIRVRLAASGFVNNAVLAKKFHCLYQLCSERLTKQIHYDFGLRNVLSVLRTLGPVRRARKEEPEEQIVMRVLRDMNMSKLVDQDEPLFLSILGDLFPNVTLGGEALSTELQQALIAETNKLGLIAHKPWLIKVQNLYDMLGIRHGVMALGPSGTGKSKAITVLIRTLSFLGTSHRELRMNPKAVTTEQMFGFLDPNSNDWVDGIFTALWRRTLRLKTTEHYWIVLDGPVDAIWIENLNSAMDDNKTLTLANGDRIPMVANCKLLFEVDSVDNASPATISRCGMVYMGITALGWSPIFEGWLLTKSEYIGRSIRPFVDILFPPLVKYVLQSLHTRMAYLEAFYIRQFCDLFDGVAEERDTMYKLGRLTIFCLVWSLGCLLGVDDRRRFDLKLRSLGFESDMPILSGDRTQTIFDFRVDGHGEWGTWADRVENYVYPTNASPVNFQSILVPNEYNVVIQFMLQTIGKQRKCVLLMGESGTGKTVMIRQYLASQKPEDHISKLYSFSSATTPAIFQRGLESFVERRVGSTYGPPGSKQMTIFIDDINMPVINEWGDQVVNELIRQLIEAGGCYSLDKLGEFLTIMDIQFVAAMVSPGGGRCDLPMRLKRHFCVFNTTLPSAAAIDHIFRTIALGYFCSANDFGGEVIWLIQELVPLTRLVWENTKNKILPTPAKFHYVFNLRDLSRIWQGMMNVDSEIYSSKKHVIYLWQHEVRRVLSDRLVSAEDQNCFDQILRETAAKYLDSKLLEHVVKEVFLVDFMRDEPDEIPEEGESEAEEEEVTRIYEPVEDIEVVKNRILELQDRFNEDDQGQKAELVLFEDSIRHMVRMARALRTPGGHILLIGAGGSGKTSLALLSAKIANCRTFQSVNSGGDISAFIEDLKDLHRNAGKDGLRSILLFQDDKVRDETYLEYVNQILTTGFIPNLFQRDEMEEMAAVLETQCQRIDPKRAFGYDELTEYYVDRLRKNLHVVFCSSPVGEAFRQRAMSYPGILAGCVVDWFFEWPEEALAAVARRFLTNFPPVSDKYINAAVSIHMYTVKTSEDYCTRHNRTISITPQSFLKYLGQIKTTYNATCSQITASAEHMAAGVEKLHEAQQAIDELRIILSEKEIMLQAAREKTEVVLSQVTDQAQIAEKVRAEVQQFKDKYESIVACISTDREAAQLQLEDAKPALAEAEEALNILRPSDMGMLRKLQKPPNLIMRIMDCVLIMFYAHMEPVRADYEKGALATSWNEALRLIFNQNFLSSLLSYPRHRMNDEIVDLLEPYMNAPDYSPAVARKVCGNVAGLLQWTLSMVKYYYVSKTVIPLEDNLASLEQKLSKAEVKLAAAEAVLREKTIILTKAQLQYEEAVTQKTQLESETEKCFNRMSVAHQLIDALSSELVRWTEQGVQLKTQIHELGGDTLQLAAFLNYCGAFNQHFRTRLLRHWLLEVVRFDLPHRHKLDIISQYADQALIDEWCLHGLPMDDLSIQNAIIVTNGLGTPLLIDPQAQGRRWLVSYYAKTLTSTSINDRALINVLEDAMNLGRPLLIEDLLEDIPPLLDDLVTQNATKTDVIRHVKLGDRLVTMRPGFKLFMGTHLANPQFPPELGTRFCLIDFTITPKGLEDQLLARVINIERQKVERTRIELMANVAAGRRQVKELEETLLHRLVSCEGSLVDDLDLITVLQHTKDTAQTVAQQLSQAADAEAEIESAREEFRPVAARGSLIFFLLSHMSAVNKMYQNGLPQFISLFDGSLIYSEKSVITQKRIQKILRYMTSSMWSFFMRSLYKKDRIVFTLMLAIRIGLFAGAIKPEELEVFVRGGSAYSLDDCPPKPGRWISDMTWTNLRALSTLPTFSNIMEHVTQHERQWRHWYDKEAPEDVPFPNPYETEMKPFIRLLVLRCWCLDRVLPQAKRFIVKTLGAEYIEDVLLNFEILYAQSTSWTPMLNLLSTGADPSPLIEQLAKKKHIELHAVAMGQGQDVQARQAVKHAMSEGSWVLLQNCHLSMNYMKELYSLVMTNAPKGGMLSARYLQEGAVDSSISVAPITEHSSKSASIAADSDSASTSSSTSVQNNDFRLWLTAAESDKFPVNLLQGSIKYTNQEPEGIKASLLRAYSDVTQDLLEACISSEWKTMLYTLAFMHCTLQERRKYGALGWSVPYDFTRSDFTASLQFIQNHVDTVEFSKKNTRFSGIDWKCVRYMIGEIQYGGRITDDLDRRLLNTFTARFFHEQMFATDFDLAPGYSVPLLNTVAQYEAHIQCLPTRDSPEAFHLHPNADIDYSNRTGAYIVDCFRVMTPKGRTANVLEDSLSEDTSNVKKKVPDKEAVVTQVCNEMFSKLPSPIETAQLSDRLESMGLLQPMHIFLRQEAERMNYLLQILSSNIKALTMALQGIIAMSQQLREMMDVIYEAKVPPSWIKISWETTTLGFWFSELLDRFNQVSTWLWESRPLSFWITGFFNPQSFLTALRQEVARQNPSWALESVVLCNRVTRMSLEEIRDRPVDGVYVHGLYLQGACWDYRIARIIEPRPKQLFDPLPVINFSAQMEVAPGQFVGGFSTPETPPGKFTFRAPPKPKARMARMSITIPNKIKLPLLMEKPREGDTMSNYGRMADADTGPMRRKMAGLPPLTKVAPRTSSYEISEGSSTRIYIAPIYKKMTRTSVNYITMVQLPCSRSAEHWILRSVAVIGDLR